MKIWKYCLKIWQFTILDFSGFISTVWHGELSSILQLFLFLLTLVILVWHFVKDFLKIRLFLLLFRYSIITFKKTFRKYLVMCAVEKQLPCQLNYPL
jgi:hypothetical protein